MTAVARLRAGFTEALSTGMAIRWMADSVRPMAIAAKPAGARLDVAPMMTKMKRAVSTTSMMKAESIE